MKAKRITGIGGIDDHPAFTNNLGYPRYLAALGVDRMNMYQFCHFLLLRNQCVFPTQSRD